MPRAVAMGYSNMWWPVHEAGRPDRYSDHFTLPFLILSALAALWRLPALRLEAPLDWGRGAVHRVRLRAARLLPDRAAAQRLRAHDEHDDRAAVRARAGRARSAAPGSRLDTPWTSAAPASSSQRWLWRSIPTIRAAALERAVGHPRPGDFNTISVNRAAVLPTGAWRSSGPRRQLADEPLLAGGADLSMRRFLDFATDVHRMVGARRTLVTDLGGRAWTGAQYTFWRI